MYSRGSCLAGSTDDGAGPVAGGAPLGKSPDTTGESLCTLETEKE